MTPSAAASLEPERKEARRVLHFSTVLDRMVFLDEVEDLTDEELVKLSIELTHVHSSVKAYFTHFKERFDMLEKSFRNDDATELEVKAAEVNLLKTKKKYYYVKKFVLEIERERERRFQVAQGLSFGQEEARQVMNLIRDRRKNLFTYAMDVETQEVFHSLLKESLGEKSLEEMINRAKVIANVRLLGKKIRSSTPPQSELKTVS